MEDLWENGDNNKNNSFNVPDPSESAKAAYKIADEFNQATKKNTFRGIGMFAAGFVGLLALAPVSPLLALGIFNSAFIANAYMKKKSSTDMRDAFNNTAQNFDIEMEDLLQPIQELTDTIQDFSISELNPVNMFKDSPINTVLGGVIFLFATGLFPGMYADIATSKDSRNNALMRMKTEQVKNEIRSRYPDLNV